MSTYEYDKLDCVTKIIAPDGSIVERFYNESSYPKLMALADFAPGFVGLDQANFRVPRSLIGRGEVDVVLTTDGKAANSVRLNIR